MNQILENDIAELLRGCIFKYGPIEHVQRTLQEETLGFKSLHSFNDIYESEYRLAHFFESTEEMDKWTRGPVNPFGRVKDLACRYLDSVKVTCFSHSATNNLMWSHYSDHHTGICYCFDFQNKSKSPFHPQSIGWGNVIYSTLIPEIHVFQNSTTEGILEMLLTNVVLTKSADWAYEKEIRFYLRQEDNYLNYVTDSLKAVIIGRRTPDPVIVEIDSFVSKYNAENGTNVRLLFAHRIPSSYNLGIHSNRDFREGSESSFNCRIPVLSSINSPVVTGNKIDE